MPTERPAQVSEHRNVKNRVSTNTDTTKRRKAQKTSMTSLGFGSFILSSLKKYFNLQSDIPLDFDGIPSAFLLSSWFFASKKEKDPKDIPLLWELAINAISNESLNSLFDQCLNIKKVGFAKLTVGLFWLQPQKFLPYDKNTENYLGKRGISLRQENYESYFELLQEVRSKIGQDFAQISCDARTSKLKPNQTNHTGGLALILPL